MWNWFVLQICEICKAFNEKESNLQVGRAVAELNLIYLDATQTLDSSLGDFIFLLLFVEMFPFSSPSVSLNAHAPSVLYSPVHVASGETGGAGSSWGGGADHRLRRGGHPADERRSGPTLGCRPHDCPHHHQGPTAHPDRKRRWVQTVEAVNRLHQHRVSSLINTVMESKGNSGMEPLHQIQLSHNNFSAEINQTNILSSDTRCLLAFSPAHETSGVVTCHQGTFNVWTLVINTFWGICRYVYTDLNIVHGIMDSWMSRECAMVFMSQHMPQLVWNICPSFCRCCTPLSSGRNVTVALWWSFFRFGGNTQPHFDPASQWHHNVLDRHCCTQEAEADTCLVGGEILPKPALSVQQCLLRIHQSS